MSYLLLLTVLFSVSCAKPQVNKCGVSYNETTPNNERIVHGMEAKQGAWPWIVSLSKWGLQKCGGSIISDRWIVTAAHCFTGYPEKSIIPYPSEWKIEVGDHEIYTDSDDGDYPSVPHEVEVVVKHEAYDRNNPILPADIALVKLMEPIQFNERVQPICLPGKSDEFDEFESQCYSAGWGEALSTADNMFALQEIHSEIINPDVCYFAYNTTDPETMICFGDGRKATCTGDSGGPLMCKRSGAWMLVGALSGGDEKCQNRPSIFTKIAVYRDWIEEQMKNHLGETPLERSELPDYQWAYGMLDAY